MNVVSRNLIIKQANCIANVQPEIDSRYACSGYERLRGLLGEANL